MGTSASGLAPGPLEASADRATRGLTTGGCAVWAGRPSPGGPAWRAGPPAVIGYLPPRDGGTGRADGAALVNWWRGLAAGACLCTVATRVSVRAATETVTGDLLVLAVCLQTTPIG